MKTLVKSIALAVIFGTSSYTLASPGQNTQAVHMVEFGLTSSPIGHVQFCQQFTADCTGRSSKVYRNKLTQERWNELVTLNHEVNETIKPRTDMQIFAVPELWTYPATYGDCEDYVILKRRLLIDRGWHPSALRITVVLDEKGLGHAVLTVSTDRGDVILDNMRNEVLMWNQTGYTFIKRQSGTAPADWVSLRPTNQNFTKPTAQLGE